MTKEINEKKVLWLSSSNPSCVIVKPLQNLRNCVKDEPPVHEPIATQKNLLYMDLCSLLPDFLGVSSVHLDIHLTYGSYPRLT